MAQEGPLDSRNACLVLMQMLGISSTRRRSRRCRSQKDARARGNTSPKRAPVFQQLVDFANPLVGKTRPRISVERRDSGAVDKIVFLCGRECKTQLCVGQGLLEPIDVVTRGRRCAQRFLDITRYRAAGQVGRIRGQRAHSSQFESQGSQLRGAHHCAHKDLARKAGALGSTLI